MKLQLFKDEFEQLSSLAGNYFGISSTNIKRDYYIVMILLNLYNSEYKDDCVFKGGTSLSKCYKNSIERFSEDIDLSFIPKEGMNDKMYDKTLKKIESCIVRGFEFEKISEKRSLRSKSSWIWHKNEVKDETKVMLELGSSVVPYPYSRKEIKSYIQEYLELKSLNDDIKKYELVSFEINVLDVRRTFIDKLLAVKRHAIKKDLYKKVRHIYDVTRLYSFKEINDLLNDKKVLKELLIKAKDTDKYYLQFIKTDEDYNPLGKYDFDSWSKSFNNEVRKNYKNLKEILFNKATILDIDVAIKIFKKINIKINEIDE